MFRTLVRLHLAPWLRSGTTFILVALAPALMMLVAMLWLAYWSGESRLGPDNRALMFRVLCVLASIPIGLTVPFQASAASARPTRELGHPLAGVTALVSPPMAYGAALVGHTIRALIQLWACAPLLLVAWLVLRPPGWARWLMVPHLLAIWAACCGVVASFLLPTRLSAAGVAMVVCLSGWATACVAGAKLSVILERGRWSSIFLLVSLMILSVGWLGLLLLRLNEVDRRVRS